MSKTATAASTHSAPEESTSADGIHIGGCGVAGTVASGSSCHRSCACGTCSISTWHNKSPFTKSSSRPYHFCSTLRTGLWVAGLAHNVGGLVSAAWTNTLSARSGGKRTAHSASACPLATTSASAAAPAACSLSKSSHNEPFQINEDFRYEPYILWAYAHNCSSKKSEKCGKFLTSRCFRLKERFCRSKGKIACNRRRFG